MLARGRAEQLRRAGARGGKAPFGNAQADVLRPLSFHLGIDARVSDIRERDAASREVAEPTHAGERWKRSRDAIRDRRSPDGRRRACRQRRS
jgi:hypothetical protein